MQNFPSNRFSIAPMLDWTDQYCRYFHRLMSKNTLLYTEMVTTGAILYGKGDYLQRDAAEHPVALQLGGSAPLDLAQAAKAGAERGFDEINLNVGCPSDRVQNGRFGACLMAEGALVGDAVKAMRDACDLPVTVKTRIGIDDLDSYEFLCDFVENVKAQGCDTFIVHARKAWLSGLSPKQNRDIPPLDYERVYQLKRDFPELTIAINGGIKTLEDCQTHLQHLDGVMLGREVYANPYILSTVDQQLFGCDKVPLTRFEVLEKMYPYIEGQLAQGVHLNRIARHMLGLFQGLPGARAWRRHLSENGHIPGSGIEVMQKAASFVHEE
ncbi:tRNA dihydrouridine(20/20a) synthase DusA [Psychromonas sp. B3M02]|uniref:tRNA dihydrouridine(20/20a) synthase DusA n=1 Tax=Psychromonas sp. B3M02 TaxID=2267226 RepID=UPI000DE8CA72|nr:tRNA dihydrouridine(20/20a) synthase DusA [Psychromonas sp. B3M02]RBW44943.1 tRNA dihydrouridine(20/20a) synthase DusA [Psychromonas sp. B3M02]